MHGLVSDRIGLIQLPAALRKFSEFLSKLTVACWVAVAANSMDFVVSEMSARSGSCQSDGSGEGGGGGDGGGRCMTAIVFDCS